MVAERVKLTPMSVYDDSFYSAQASRSLQSARAVVPLAMEFFRPSSVVDVGCGVGTWLKAFSECGVEELRGYDGPWVKRDELLIPETSFTEIDLEQGIRADRRYDLVVCLEVAEHLDPSAAETLVSSIVSLAPAAVFSAAVPGQPGRNHINLHWPSYWRTLFARHQWRRFDALRPRIRQNHAIDSWYRDNTFIFCEPGHPAMASLTAAGRDKLWLRACVLGGRLKYRARYYAGQAAARRRPG